VLDVSVTLPPEQNVVAPPTEIVATGSGLFETFAELLLVQPPLPVTVRPSVTVPKPLGVKAMAGVPFPLSIVPFAIVHEYVAPEVAATLAFPLAPTHSDVGATIAAEGSALTLIGRFADEPQPFGATTVSARLTPVDPAGTENVIALVP
jgi:hypothetical protein